MHEWLQNIILNDTFILGFDALCCLVTYGLYRNYSDIIRNILDAQSSTREISLEEAVKANNGTVPYGVLRGKVKELESPLQSSTGLNCVLQTVTIKEHSCRRHAFGHWGDSIRTIQESKSTIPFAIKLLDDSTQSLIEIRDLDNADIDSLLVTVSTSFIPTNNSMASAFMGVFSGVAVKGVETTEDVLPVGTIVTGIGRLVRDSKGEIKLMCPLEDSSEYPYILSTLPVEAIVKQLDARAYWFKVATGIFFSAGAFLIYIRLKKWWKLRQEKKMKEGILKRRSKMDIEGMNESQICTVCLTNPREMILMDCGHVCVCADCCPKLKNKCPICRERFHSSHHAFIA